MILGALGCAAIYLWAFEGGRTSRDFPALPPSSMNAVLLALSFITLFLLASGAFAIVAVREHMQRVLGLSDAEVIAACRDPPSRRRALRLPLRATLVLPSSPNEEEYVYRSGAARREASPTSYSRASRRSQFRPHDGFSSFLNRVSTSSLWPYAPSSSWPILDT